MESQRSFLVLGLLLVSFLLWQEWQRDYGPQPVQTVQETSEAQTASADVPNAVTSGEVSADVPNPIAMPSAPVQVNGTSQLIQVTTDTLQLAINLRGGDVVDGKLMQYPISIDSNIPFEMFNENSGTLYVAQSGLIGADGPDGSATGRPVYQTTSTQFEMSGDNLVVPLVLETDEYLIAKTFTFTRGEHSVVVTYDITNKTDRALSLQQYAQLKQTVAEREGSMFMPTYRGTAYSTSDERYEKYHFSDIEDEVLRRTTTGGWIAMLEHYFVSAWVPPQTEVNNIYTRFISNQFAIIGFTGEAQTIQPQSTGQLNTTLYMGPKNQDALGSLAKNLEHTVDYGFLFWVAIPLFSLLSWIQTLVINWGLAIVIITIFVKGLMYPLTKAQYESMGKMRALQPKMQALKDKYGDDRQKMSQGMMELYKKEKVNPAGGCFPLLLQMPIFLALYWVLLESVELRHADFIFWINDLSVADPYYVLPILTGASMWLLQKLNPVTVQDPMQQKIMQWMPVAMSVFFFFFPAGLVLYWLISNVITIVQAKMIYSNMEKKGMKTH